MASSAAGAGVGGDVGVDADETETLVEQAFPLAEGACTRALAGMLKSLSLSSAVAGAAVGTSASLGFSGLSPNSSRSRRCAFSSASSSESVITLRRRGGDLGEVLLGAGALMNASGSSIGTRR
eukprot:4939307-Pleurochrysis_carterae.AAC.1